ncbi:MAG: hypothetical protein L3J82_02065, partial [Planctomycetes bacterium]|nr:hypothetical protein [Planctomycetota bacterium]
MTETGIADSTRERVTGLFKYLAERTKLKSKPVFDIRASKAYSPVLWLEKALPDEPEIWSMHRSSEADAEQESEFGIEVIRIGRVTPEEAPDPPKECLEWLFNSDEFTNWKSTPPELMKTRLVDNPDYQPDSETSEEPEHLEVFLEDHQDVSAIWELYLEVDWQPWQTERLRISKIQEVYSKLFELKQKIERDEEEFELLVSSALLAWKSEDFGRGKDTIYRHLVTLPVRIEIESNTGILRVFTDPEVAAPRLEVEMLPQTKRPSLEDVPDVEQGNLGVAQVLVPSPLHISAVYKAIKPWVNVLSGDATVDKSLLQPDKLTENDPPRVAMAPALILRKRPSTSMTAALETCQQQVLEGGDIPFNLQRVVETLEEPSLTADATSSSDDSSRHEGHSEPLFPLPSNKEQARIASRLKTSHGVLVQGPPGTGKTQTIANLICHLLAEGKRILITSAKGRPLTVLHEKLPKSVRPLCLTSLGGGRDESEQLKRSVAGILNHFATYDAEENRENVSKLLKGAKELRQEVAKLTNQRRDRLEAETRKQSIVEGKYSGMAMDIIGRVVAKQEEYAWFADCVELAVDYPCSPQWAKELAGHISTLSADERRQLGMTVPDVKALMSSVDFRESAERENLWRPELEQVKGKIDEVVKTIDVELQQKTQEVQTKLDSLRDKLSDARDELAVEQRRAERESSKRKFRIDDLKSQLDKERAVRIPELGAAIEQADLSLTRETLNKPTLAGEDLNPFTRSLTELPIDEITTAGELSAGTVQSLERSTADWEWLQRAMFEVASGNDRDWVDLLSTSIELLDDLPSKDELKSLEELLITPPVGVSDDALHYEAKELLAHLRGGGGLGFLFFKHITVKRTKQVQNTTVNGRKCCDAGTLQKLIRYFDACKTIDALHGLWSGQSKRIKGMKPSEDLVKSGKVFRSAVKSLDKAFSNGTELSRLIGRVPSSYRDVHQVDKAIQKAVRLKRSYHSGFAKWESSCQQMKTELEMLKIKKDTTSNELERRYEEESAAIWRGFTPANGDAVKYLEAEVKYVEQQLNEAGERVRDDGERRLAPLKRSKSELESNLASLVSARETTYREVLRTKNRNNPHPMSGLFEQAIEDTKADKYADLLSKLEHLETLRHTYEQFIEQLSPLAANAPKTMDWLKTVEWTKETESRLAAFNKAWNWSRARAWVDDFQNKDVDNIDHKLRKAEATISNHVAEISSLLAWRQCKERATQGQQEALKAWQKAVKRIGKGQGKYAAKHRKDAHKNMKDAQGMIPALVTPLARLVDSVSVSAEMFDIVIVDEASQLGPEGLLLYYLAKQVVIVGDDEQISPEDIGTNKAEVHALIKKYLNDVPRNDSLAENSLFDQADIRFTEGRIMLREHFRCVPEIIKFSNELCYKNEHGEPQLIPLRKVGAERIRPALKAVFVEDGFKNDNNTNEVEADRIVAAIVE